MAANRTKTIEYAFPLSVASVATATARDFTQIAALAIPETTSRAFLSVILEVSCVDNGTGASVTAVLMGIALGAVGRNDATVTFTAANSGESRGFRWSRDVTSYFATNYTGTTMTADCRLTVTGPTTINATAKLIITYEYDDTAHSTRIKTVKIPIDGNIGNLTTSLTTIGTTANQWPNLDTFLPEASKTYRDIFFEINTHTGTTAAASSALTMRYDGANSITDTSSAFTAISDISYRRIDKLLSGTGAPTTNATHSVEASVTSTTGSPFPCISGVIVVTYEYDHANSSTILNSLQFPIFDEAGWVGGTATGDKSRFTKEISIQEPTTITLVQSAVLTSHVDAGAVTLDIRCGSQGAREYVHPASMHCGGLTSQRRIDAGETGGTAGVTLARGFNTLTIDMFTSSATAGNLGSSGSGMCFLNYTSGKHADGDGVHNHTTVFLNRPYATGGGVQRLQYAPATTPKILETNYYVTAIGYELALEDYGSAAVLIQALAFHTEVQSGEAEGAGWRPLYTALFASDTETGNWLQWTRAGYVYKRWPTDPDATRLNLETTRDFRFDSGVNSTMVLDEAKVMLTHHSISYAIAGTVSNSGGGTVNLDAYRVDNGELWGSTSRSGDGAYSITAYDNTVAVGVRAWEDSTHVGASVEAVAGT